MRLDQFGHGDHTANQATIQQKYDNTGDYTALLATQLKIALKYS